MRYISLIVLILANCIPNVQATKGPIIKKECTCIHCGTQYVVFNSPYEQKSYVVQQVALLYTNPLKESLDSWKKQQDLFKTLRAFGRKLNERLNNSGPHSPLNPLH